MFFLSKPSNDVIKTVIASQKDKPYTYLDIGSSENEQMPKGYNIDHNRIELGKGKEVFEKAKKAITSWKMYNMPWVEVHMENPSIEKGKTYAAVVSTFGIWSINVCRIVYTIDEKSTKNTKFGFALGTLPLHAESGEERFSIEWNHLDDRVYYDILAFSKPNYLIVKLGQPVCRMLQKKFAQESKQAVLNFCKQP